MIDVDWSANMFCFLKQSIPADAFSQESRGKTTGNLQACLPLILLPAFYHVCHKMRFVGHISIEWEQKKLAWR